MNLLIILLNAAGVPEQNARALLEWAKSNPDFASDADKLLAELDAAISDASIDRLIAVLPTEFREILRLRLNPKDHPSDAI